MSDKEKDLHYLDDMSDYKVADDYTDPRGWEVKDTDGRTVGKVDGLLASNSAKRGMVQLDVENENVFSDRITHDTFARANRRQKRADFDRNYEVELYRLYINDDDEGLVVPLTDEDVFYDREEFMSSPTRGPM